MTETMLRTTAKIYQFPTKRGPGFGQPPRGKMMDRDLPAYPKMEFGSAWYHEAAVAELDKPRKP